MTRVAVVTGANRGIGFAIVRAFLTPGATKFDGEVILTARDENKGQKAIEKLRAEGKNAVFHKLDVTSQDSIKDFKQFLTMKYSRLDVLVNNAGIYKPPGTPTYKPTDDDLNIVNVNYTAVVNVCNALFPLLQEHARVVHVGSGYANKGIRDSSGKVQKELMSENLTLERLDQLMQDYIRYGKEKTLDQHDWSNFPYGISKTALHWHAILQQKELDKLNKDIIINVVCPGWVATDLGGPNATSTVEQGAEMPVYLSLLPPNIENPRGKYLRRGKVTIWPDKDP